MDDQALEKLVRTSLTQAFPEIPLGETTVRSERPKYRLVAPAAVAVLIPLALLGLYAVRPSGTAENGATMAEMTPTSSPLGPCFKPGSVPITRYDRLPYPEAAARAAADGYQLRTVARAGECTKIVLLVGLTNPLDVEMDASGAVVRAARPPSP